MKALVSVIFRTEEQGGRKSDPVCMKKGVPGPHYRPQFVIVGGNGDHLDMEFTEELTLVRGQRFVTEIESIFDEPGSIVFQDYGVVKKGKKFVVCEGSRIVADGSILATSPMTKED